MSGVATPAPERVGERPSERAGRGAQSRPPSGEARGGGAARHGTRSRLGVELVLFAALGTLGVLQWSRLVADPPVGRLLLALAFITAGAAALGALGARRERVPYPRLAAVAIIACAIGAAMVAVGVPARLLLPGNWAELIDNLSLGLAGIEDTDMPYDGGDVWLRLTLMVGAPLLLGLAAALAFWPARRRTPGRILGLGALVLVYGIAVTLDSPPAELAWGVVLLVLAAAWLWVPRLAPRRAAVALATTAGAGLLALPVAAALDTRAPWWDYESWDWFGREREVTFDWDHSYGPLDWPQEGTTLLEVRSVEPLYWKASVLDRFDGFTWQRAHGDDALSAAERLARRRVPGDELPELNRNWLTQASFEVESLESGLAIGAGTPQAIQGVDGATISADGTSVTDEPLRPGDEYSVVAYVPQPSESRLRRAPQRYPEERFAQTTLIGLPVSIAPASEADPASSNAGEAVGSAATDGFAPSRASAMPLWGTRDPDARAAVLASPYADVYRLARRITAGAATPYAAVRAVEGHLRQSYDYLPTVPERTYPLAAFLFEDEAGYCQQFAGTMALMLRMVGIPARVVSGFAPGSLDEERGVYEVRDTDAHSWVEVYFRGIGWVTFDPTPASAPAASQTLNAQIATFFRGRGSIPAQEPDRGPNPEEPALAGGASGSADGDPGPWATIGLGLLGGVAIGSTGAGFVFLRRRRALAGGEVVDAQLDELRRALARLGWSVPPAPTLLGLERRFRGAGRSAVARYAAGLRAHRYAPEAPAPPGPADRRALRRALRGSGGLRRRLRALLAIPPGGPR